MFKKYDDAMHWGLFIPIGRKRPLWVLTPAEDEVVRGIYRLHLCITVKITNIKILREIRIRIGKQYL